MNITIDSNKRAESPHIARAFARTTDRGGTRTLLRTIGSTVPDDNPAVNVLPIVRSAHAWCYDVNECHHTPSGAQDPSTSIHDDQHTAEWPWYAPWLIKQDGAVKQRELVALYNTPLSMATAPSMPETPLVRYHFVCLRNEPGLEVVTALIAANLNGLPRDSKAYRVVLIIDAAMDSEVAFALNEQFPKEVYPLRYRVDFGNFDDTVRIDLLSGIILAHSIYDPPYAVLSARTLYMMAGGELTPEKASRPYRVSGGLTILDAYKLLNPMVSRRSAVFDCCQRSGLTGSYVNADSDDDDDDDSEWDVGEDDEIIDTDPDSATERDRIKRIRMNRYRDMAHPKTPDDKPATTTDDDLNLPKRPSGDKPATTTDDDDLDLPKRLSGDKPATTTDDDLSLSLPDIPTRLPDKPPSLPNLPRLPDRPTSASSNATSASDTTTTSMSDDPAHMDDDPASASDDHTTVLSDDHRPPLMATVPQAPGRTISLEYVYRSSPGDRKPTPNIESITRSIRRNSRSTASTARKPLDAIVKDLQLAIANSRLQRLTAKKVSERSVPAPNPSEQLAVAMSRALKRTLDQLPSYF